jgi:WD40 repeat protein
LWDARSGALAHVLRGHRAALTSISFSPDGRLLVTGSVDFEARIWSVATGRTLHRLIAHFAAVDDATFSQDGRWIVTAGPSTAGLWPTQTGRLLLYLYGHSFAGHLTSASFSPDGSRVLTSSADGTVRFYACGVCLAVDGLVSLAEARLAELASGLTPAQRLRYASVLG